MDAGKTLREHGLRIGELEPGPTASIADVAGVAVGHSTVGSTGVTALLPGPIEGLWAEPVPAGVAVLNGAGELTGSLQIAEWGRIETPVYLTATMSVGRVYDGAVAAAMAAEPQIGVEAVVIPVVGECDDSWLNDPRVAQVETEDVQRALADAAGSESVAQGAVGAGRGMVSFGWKGGIGSSSRVTGGGHTVGVLVLANYGDSSDLRIDGVPVGRQLDTRRAPIATPPAAASRWWPPTRRSERLSSRASRGAPDSAWLGPAPWRTTEAARSSSRSPPRRGRRATSRRGRRFRTASSTRSSSRPWTPPRRRC